MNLLLSLTSAQLKRAAAIKEQIARLEKELSGIIGHSKSTTKAQAAKPVKAKRKMSAAGRARIIAAQKARWAKVKSSKK